MTTQSYEKTGKACPLRGIPLLPILLTIGACVACGLW
jgi:hypothetical protein